MPEKKTSPEPEKDASPQEDAPQQETAPQDEAQQEAEADVSDATDQVQTVVDKETEQGFRGTEVDLTPNENYTVAGVTSGADVPEAHADKAAAIREATNPEVNR